MASDGIRALDGNFLRTLSALDSSGSSSSPLTSASTGAASTTFTGLRTGARAYSLAVQSLNGVISGINIAEATLVKLGELTDELLTLTERAAKGTTGQSTRARLDREFDKIVAEFRDVAGSAAIGEDNLLSRDGLKNIFALVGLDEEESNSIAEIFEMFSTPPETNQFADEKIKGKRPVRIPAAALPTGVTSNAYELVQVTNVQDVNADSVTVSDGRISKYGAFITSPEDPVGDISGNGQNQNGVETVATYQLDGAVNQLAKSPANDSRILGVSEGGYSLIVSQEDFLGFNSGGFEQAYILDQTGAIVQQASANNSDLNTIEVGDISADGKTWAILYNFSGGADNTIGKTTITEFGVDPSTIQGPANTTVTAGLVSRALFEYDDLILSEDGSHVAYRITDVLGLGGFGANAKGIVLVDQNNVGDSALTLGTAVGKYASFGFVDSSGIAMHNIADNKLSYYQYGAGTVNTSEEVTLADSIDFMAFSEASASGDAFGTVVYTAGTKLTYFGISSENGRYTESVSPGLLAGLTSISALSASENLSGGVDFGVVGVNPGDATPQLFRLSSATFTTTNSVASISSPDVEKVLDNTIRKRPEAFRTKTDLLALKEQIQKNVVALRSTSEKLADILEVTRQTGLAMLDLSNQLRSNEDANAVASRLQLLLRQRGGTELSEYGDTLAPIARAILNRDDDE